MTGTFSGPRGKKDIANGSAWTIPTSTVLEATLSLDGGLLVSR